MKTNLTNSGTILFLHRDHHKEPASLSGSLPANKTHCDRKMTMVSRQLIYKATADDIFWVFNSKLQGKKQLGYAHTDPLHL